MFTARLFAVVALAVAAGCATPPAKDHGTANATAASDVQCHMVETAGTMISKKVCTTKAMRDAQRADINDLQSIATQPTPCRDPKSCGSQ